MAPSLASPVRMLRTGLDSLRQPATQTDLVQLVKSVVAAVAAWLLADQVFDLAQPFLAPWTALLTVHATVHRSLSRGAQTVAATALGIVVSFLVVATIGTGTTALGLALLIGLLLARAGVLRDEGVTVATTALFVITTGVPEDALLLSDRLLDVALGVATGVLVNMVVFPPLADRSAQQRVRRINRQMGALMREMADELASSWDQERADAWIERTRSMDDELEDAWQLVRHARESSWWNPRRLVSRGVGDTTVYEQVLRRLEDGIAQLRAMARTIDESTRTAQQWDERFRAPWIRLLAEVGHRIASPTADVAAVRGRLDELTHELSSEDLPSLYWPVYGALICDLGNLVDMVDDVASSGPVHT